MTSGNVAVTAGNSCGTSSASQLAVTLVDAPATPGPITGPTSVCIGTTVDYSVPAVSGITNNWTVPFDATITAGQGTPFITVQWGVNTGDVAVTAQSGACISPAATLNVGAVTLPGAAQAISGPDTVCQGDGGYQFSVPVISNATTYVWTLPAGAAISQGQGTNTILVDFGGSAVSGNITAAGSNLCGTGSSSSAIVTVVVCSGNEEKRLNSEIRIYPNPVHGMLNISIRGSEKQLRLQITDINGKSMYQETLEELTADCTRQIDTRGYLPGVYILKLVNDSRVYLGKFTVN
jgi:hypothetical protein